MNLLEFKPASVYKVQGIEGSALLTLRGQQAGKRLTPETLQSARPDKLIRKSYRSCLSNVFMMAGQLKLTPLHTARVYLLGMLKPYWM